jgi:hypothetical protein
MLMVVFGAGASHDSMNPKKYSRADLAKPPLANKLFHDSYGNIIGDYPVVSAVVDRFRGLPDTGPSVEQVMQQLLSEAGEYPARLSHLTAVRYYLRELLDRCGHAVLKQSYGATNYVALLDEIERWRHTPQGRGTTIVLVTFNYDRLLEAALAIVPGFNIGTFRDYVSRDDYKLFKLHGSVDWTHPASFNGTVVNDPHQIIELSSKTGFSVTDEFCLRDSRPDSVYPALAIPVEIKDQYECPGDHLEQLRSLLPAVSRVLVVGWRATEQHFTSEWSSLVPSDLERLGVVAEDDRAVGMTATNLERAGIRLSNLYPAGECFSGLMGDSLAGFLA